MGKMQSNNGQYIKDGRGWTDAMHIHDGAIAADTAIHDKIHEGLLFTCSDYMSDLDAGQTLSLHLITPNDGSDIESNWTISVSGLSTAQLFENGTVSDLGTACATINQNRSSSNTSTVLGKKDSTFSADGSELFILSTGASGPGQAKSSGSDDLFFWILKPNEDYELRITSKAADVSGSLDVEFYNVPVNH